MIEKYLPLLLLTSGCVHKDPDKTLMDSFDSEIRERVETVYAGSDPEEFRRISLCVTPTEEGQFVKPGGEFDPREEIQMRWWTDEQSRVITASFIDLQNQLAIDAEDMEAVICGSKVDVARLDLSELNAEDLVTYGSGTQDQSDYAATKMLVDGSIKVNMNVYGEAALRKIQPTATLFHEWVHVIQTEESNDFCRNTELREGMADTLSNEFFGNEEIIVAYPLEDLKLAFLGKDYLRAAFLDINSVCRPDSESWESPLFIEGMYRFFDEHGVAPTPGNIALFKSIYEINDQTKDAERLARISEIIQLLGLDWDQIQNEYLVRDSVNQY